MNKLFYPKLAINNIKKNSKMYIPYILTCIGTIMMFYNMYFLVLAKDIGSLSEKESLRTLLFLGTVVTGIFSVIFLFYTNSFLIKNRKKEFGLFNILGMEKKHVASIMFFETLFISILSILTGILAGILFSKLMILFLFRIINFEVTFGFEIPIKAVCYTLLLFVGIFTLNLGYNIFQVYISKPVELLKGSNIGEKEPKTKWILTIIGTICLGSGYYIALTTESPIAAINIFFVAVVLVMIGTYCLFTAGSVAVLKVLRNNKKYYYKSKHFISVSGMIYRMKQNAVGLSNICILSTAVIIMISTTISMYIGMEDVLRTRYPRNIIVEDTDISDEQAVQLDNIIEKQTSMLDVNIMNVSRYRSISIAAMQNDDSNFISAESSSYISKNMSMLLFVTIDEYNKMENKNLSLSSDEALLYVASGDIPSNIISFNNFKLSIKERLDSLYSEKRNLVALTNSYFVVVDSIETINKIYDELMIEDGDMGELSYYYGFDVNADKDVQIHLVSSLQNAINNSGINAYAEGAESSRSTFLSIYGGLFFLGLFLGFLFIMATVLIIYYKQIAEGYDDKERFEIMQKVGMSHGEIKKSIQSQILTVFFMPLVAAVIHLAFAFKVITKLLLLLNLSNIPLFAICAVITIFVFTIFYAIVYALTARTYYKIVS
ncbi:putative ABC transport system permease protein [Sedimentibacter acidaminivorans]|uniref:ABC transport system permease protein n=1 Tax=Sedimentibacter acidaminivorans TaxID=913099 RepID=A0ABS4GHP2_9FIRM|nr:ABC transporter permease [Sedimentibacter acidaminivorans]MBP1927220.1 putative ABC transport system permease protein [Sedimentibacter acidaminivorans]